MPTLTSLAEEILENAKRIDEHLASQQQPSPSFYQDERAKLPRQLEPCRDALTNTTHTLNQLVQGPVRSTVNVLFSWTDILSLRAIYEYRIPHAVPLDSSASYSTIAHTTSVPELKVRQFVRSAISNRVFAPSPSSPDSIIHTAASALMLKDPDFFDIVGMASAELAPAGGHVIDALRKWGDCGEQNRTGFSLANGTDLGIYGFLAEHPERARRFGAGMRFFTKSGEWDLRHLIAGFDWASDEGGEVRGAGSSGTAEEGRKVLPKEFEGRIEFQARDFFKELRLERKPEVFLFRYIFHNWSDGYCLRILRNLVSEMRNGARLVIYEYVLSEEPGTKLTEKVGSNLDMVMASNFNSAERTARQYRDVLKRADDRFEMRKFVQPEGSVISIVEVVWTED